MQHTRTLCFDYDIIRGVLKLVIFVKKGGLGLMITRCTTYAMELVIASRDFHLPKYRVPASTGREHLL